MIKIEAMKSLLYNHTKVWVPYDVSNRSKGYFFFMINSPKQSIADLFNDNCDAISNNGGIYRAYYYNYKLLPKCIQSKRVVNSGLKIGQARKNYLLDCQEMNNLSENLKTPLNIESIAGKNFIYDLNPVAELYGKQDRMKNATLIQRLRAYFDTVNKFTTLTFPGYTSTGYIFVDLSAYESKTTNYDSHILYNLILLLRRSEKIISQFNYNYKLVFYNKTGSFLFNMATDLRKANYSKLMRVISRLGISAKIEKDVIDAENREVAAFIAKQAVKSNATGTNNELVNQDDILNKDEEIIDDIRDKMNDDLNNIEDKNSSIDDIFNDETLKQEYNDAIITKNAGKKSESSIKRDQMLREKQKNIVVNGKTIEDITKTKTIAPIKPHKIENDNITNPSLKEIKFPEFNKEYMETTYQKDIVNSITCVNNATLPVNIVDIKVEDTSDTLNYKETYTITMEGSDRKRHKVVVDLPKFIDNKYMYINGNKKVIQNQFFTYPVAKTGPDEVQICTNYNKIFIRRVGAKFSANSEKLRKLIGEPENTISVHNGCSTEENKAYLTCLEYDELAKLYSVINIGNASFVFNAKVLSDEFDGKEQSTGDKILVGYSLDKGNKKVPIYYDRNDSDHVDLVSLMMSYAPDDIRSKFESMSTGKKFVHTEATVMAKKIPVIVLLGFFEGLDKVLRKFNDNTVKFFDKKDNPHYQYIKFQDGYLGYPMSNMEACMLFNGLTEVPTNAYTVNDMNERATYLEIFEYLYGSSYVAGALINYYDFMIDPITLEILELLDYPTDIVSLTIFANNLLADNDYRSDNNLNQYRIRHNEVIPAILYKNIVRSYSRYRQTANNPNPMSISMDRNAVIKEIMALPTVEDYSTLSPMVEMHKDGLVSMKGANGMNLERAYKLDKRAYDDSMLGIVGISTDPGPTCGAIRHLVAEPKVINTRGFMDMTEMNKAKDLADANLVTPVEMLTPLTTTKDNSTRNAMATKQTGHVIPVEKNCPMLVSTGMDEAVHYRTGDDFSVIAKQDGKVVELVSDQIMVVEYKDGSTQAIDLSSRVVKNGGGGFFLVNKLSPKVKLNQSFKKDTLLAYDPKYYRDQRQMGNKLTMGALVKTAVISNFSTFEDSCFITRHMSEKMASVITMQKHVIIGANSNVDYIVKPGQEIAIGEDLIRYETSYDDDELNKLLAGVRSDMKEEIVNLGKSKLTSSYNGVVADVIMYPSVDLGEMSPSLQKVVKDYQKKVKDTEKIIQTYSKDNKQSCYRMGMIMNKPSGVVEPDQYGKIKGYDVGKGVLIEFYISYRDEMSDGDKAAASTANKSTVGYVVPKGFEAYSEFRPYEEISAPIAPSAVLQRGTPSVITTGSVYKVLIELKRKMYEVLTGENYDEVLKQKQPWMVKDTNTTKESLIVNMTDSDINLLESTFDLEVNNGSYIASKYYACGDIIMIMKENVDCTPMLEKFGVGIANVAIDDETGFIRAIDDIIPGEPLILREFV